MQQIRQATGLGFADINSIAKRHYYRISRNRRSKSERQAKRAPQSGSAAGGADSELDASVSAASPAASAAGVQVAQDQSKLQTPASTFPSFGAAGKPPSFSGSKLAPNRPSIPASRCVEGKSVG